MEYQLVTPRHSTGFDIEGYVGFHMSVCQLMTLRVSNVDVFVTLEFIHLCILCIVTQCLFQDVSIM